MAKFAPWRATGPAWPQNRIRQHQARWSIPVASNLSPWLMHHKPGDVHLLPISYGGGAYRPGQPCGMAAAPGAAVCRPSAAPAWMRRSTGGSDWTIEGITHCGRVLGKMANSGDAVSITQICPATPSAIFRGAVDYRYNINKGRPARPPKPPWIKLLKRRLCSAAKAADPKQLPPCFRQHPKRLRGPT